MRQTQDSMTEMLQNKEIKQVYSVAPKKVIWHLILFFLSQAQIYKLQA